MRDAIAAAMSRSKREIPHYYLAHPISLRRSLAALAARNAGLPVRDRVLPAALLLRAVARALWEVPELNGRWLDGGFAASEAIHLGVAIALRTGGLVVPALRDVGDKPAEVVMRELEDLVTRARSGGLRASELGCATITVTSLGDRGCEAVWGVIDPPQVALVGFGTIAARPWVEDGQLAVHPVVTATLSADHRVSDGHRGARFLAALDRALQEPPA
jgi:pyruvate dehydrogenase E2 component (dihydrolipoamide acetyltransferase)